jgi:aspartyl-tRNA(Asn)/glutamyl-tRNA(Gln) amidotransferase subunit A
MKPSYGLVSTRGVVPLSHGLDHAGPLARSVADAAIMLEILGGFDPACPQSRRGPAIRQDAIRPTRLDGVRIGVVSNFAAERTEPVVVDAFNAALDKLSGLGATIRSVELPTYDVVRGRRAGFARVEAEVAFVHGPLHEKEPWRFSPEIRTCLDYGARMPATRLLEVNRRIEVAAFELCRCLEQVDAIVSPTTPQAAPAFGGPPNDNAGAFCILANFAGTPAISVPMGFDEAGLPLGLQIIGALHHDAQVLQIAASYEAAAGLAMEPRPPSGSQA